MNSKFQYFPDETIGGDSQPEPNTSGDGFSGLCDLCSFHVPCNPDFDVVKRKCDDHNIKNPGHDAAPINCTL